MYRSISIVPQNSKNKKGVKKESRNLCPWNSQLFNVALKTVLF